MAFAKRIFLFLAINFLVIITLSLVLNIFHVQPFLKGYGLDIRSLLIFCLIWGMGGAFISLALSRQMAKWMMGVHVINPDTHDPDLRRLIATVHQLARDAHLPDMPEVGVFESSEPNAFATGPTKRRSLVAVSTGLLRRMSQKELEGVLAHEIAHISNGDMVTMTLVQGVVNAFVMFLARVLAYVVSGLGRNREQGSGGSYFSYMMFVFLFEVVFMVLGSIVVCSFSRFREFRADRGGADLAGKDKMIAALESLQKMQEVRDPHVDKPSFAAFKISTRKKSGFMMLFATHPPLEDRIARLKHLA
ncbi:MAG: protease HtpX [Verrucomicrobia bacterium]|nr:protease HtpX [Verrucomicrobiota bacterium]